MTLINTKQTAIPLTNIVELSEQIRQLVTQEPMIAILVPGPAGVGKSTWLQYFLKDMYVVGNTMLPSWVQILSPPSPSPQSLMTSIAEMLEEKSGGQDLVGMIQHTRTILQRNKVKLLIVDHADRLSVKCFRFLCKVQADWQQPIIMVGLPNLSSQFEKINLPDLPKVHEKSFPQPTPEIVIGEFLPQFRLKNWHFDPNNPADYRLGQHLWQQVRPSLHKLVNILQLASAMAALEETHITQEIVDECLALMGLECCE